MPTINVVRELNAPIDKLFAILTDHANFASFPGVDASELTKQGTPAPNGTGAQRKLKIGAATIIEDIVGFEENALLEYRISKITPKLIHHKIGRQIFEDLGGGRTKVTWTSELEPAVPLIGHWLLKPLVKQFSGGFHAMLSAAEKRAQA